jgi:RNA polymerase-binding transcription factor DksA
MEKHKIQLEIENNLLEEELKSLGKLDVETGNWEATPENEVNTQEVQDEGDMAERTEDYEERSIKLRTLEARLRDIKHALLLIENGEYGTCEVCHIKIEEERLEANPSARTCEACMEKV